MTTKRQALFVYIPRGHHLSHVKMLHELGALVDLITTKEFVDKLEVDASDLLVNVHYLGDSLGAPFQAYQLLRKFVGQKKLYDEIITTSLDEMWRPLLFRFLGGQSPLPNGISFSGIWVGANFLYQASGSPKRVVCGRLLTRICRGLTKAGGRVLFFNESLCALMAKKLPDSQRSLIVCPDPYQEVLFLGGDVKRVEKVPMLFMAGHHTERKGTFWALRALSSWSGPMIRVVIAGVCEDTDSLNYAIRHLPDTVKVECVNRWVSDEELSSFYRSATAVLLPYRRFGGSSGVFVNALAHRCPVIVPDWGVIGERVRHLNCGILFEHDSDLSFLSAIRSCISSEVRDFDYAKVAGYLSFNSPNLYARVLLCL